MAEKQLKVLKLQKLPEDQSSSTKESSLQLLATLCYYYPAYTLATARKLPFKHVVLMIRTARKLEAQKYYNLAQIAGASSPHVKNLQGIKDIAKQFKGIMNG